MQRGRDKRGGAEEVLFGLVPNFNIAVHTAQVVSRLSWTALNPLGFPRHGPLTRASNELSNNKNKKKLRLGRFPIFLTLPG